MGDLYTCRKCFHLVVVDCLIKWDLRQVGAVVNWACQHKHYCCPEVLAFQVHVIEGWLLKLFVFSAQLYTVEIFCDLTILLIAKSLVFFKSFSTSLKGSSMMPLIIEISSNDFSFNWTSDFLSKIFCLVSWIAYCE